MKPGKLDLSNISARMESASPQVVLQWAADTYGPHLAMATAFQAEGCAIISMLAGISKDVFIFNLDTGYQFAETLDTRERLVKQYGVKIHLVSSPQSVDEMEAEHGGPIYGSQPDLCCHLRKVVPLRDALQGYEAWVSSIRREQSPTRTNAPMVSWDEKFGLVKVNPLAKWTKQELWKYILSNDVPYNVLHDKGYPSIGCWPCTRAVGAGEDERAGRWAGHVKTECGLHVLAEPNSVAFDVDAGELRDSP